MKLLRFPLLAFLLLVSIAIAAAAPGKVPARTPVVLVTDIGTDIDDTWALAMLLRSPELDLKLVLADSGDARYRATVTAKFLEVSGRSDVPVGIGSSQGVLMNNDQNQAPWIAGYVLAKYPGTVHEDGIAAMIDLIRKSAEPVTVIALGPVPGIAQALQKAPDIAAKCRFVGMHGSFDKGYGDGPPSAESNVKVDPAALRVVLAAPWRDILLTPLDTCGLVQLTGPNYHSIWCATEDPMLRALIEGYCVFAPRVTWMKCDFFATRSTTLFDCVAVYLAYSEALVETETVSFDVTDDGFTRRSAHGPYKARVALRWKNLAGFEDHLTGRLLGK